MRVLADLASAFGLLTRVPVGHLAPPGTDHARAIWAYPVAGLAVGGLGGCVYAACIALRLAPALAAVWTLAAMTLATGGLHEDGLADTADGFGGGRTPGRRLEIMRDSRIGSYGAMALLSAFAVRGVAIAAIAEPARVAAALVASGALGRGAILLVLRLAPPARADGLSAGLAGAGWRPVTLGCAIALAAAFLTLPWREALACSALAGATAPGLAVLSGRLTGGHTGDVLGACAVVAECLALSVLSH